MYLNGIWGKSVVIFGADMSSPMHVDNKTKDILALSNGPTQGLDDASITAEAKYPINFTQSGKKFVLSLYYNESISLLFVIAVKCTSLKQKILK